MEYGLGRSLYITENFLSLVLYPALADGLSKGEKEVFKAIVEGMDGVEPTQVNDTIPQSTSASEMCRLASMVPDDQNIITCALAK
jgi:hypothetical protein